MQVSDEGYTIEHELKARKILEQNTSPTTTFEKNEDMYGYDLKVFRYELYKNDDYEKQFMGYAEIECSTCWKDSTPPVSWEYLSFLKRKLYTRAKDQWLGPKQDTDRAIYFRFNHKLNCCYCQKMDYIIEHGRRGNRICSGHNLTGYTDSYVELPRSQVIIGIGSCSEFLDKLVLTYPPYPRIE